VILDAKLSWKQQVEAKCKKALALMCQLPRVTGETWGMTPKTVIWLYTALAGGKGGILTSVGWQVTLSDPTWHVSFP